MPQFDGMTAESAAHHSVSRRWVLAASAGFLGITCILMVVMLVVMDKPRFGGLAGSRFLQTIVIGMLLGAIVMLVSAFNCVRGHGWRKLTLIAWALVGLASPAFGWMIILPWAAMAAFLPVVLVAFYGLWHQAR